LSIDGFFLGLLLLILAAISGFLSKIGIWAVLKLLVVFLWQNPRVFSPAKDYQDKA
jgi:hypothetical protein